MTHNVNAIETSTQLSTNLNSPKEIYKKPVALKLTLTHYLVLNPKIKTIEPIGTSIQSLNLKLKKLFSFGIMSQNEKQTTPKLKLKKK